MVSQYCSASANFWQFYFFISATLQYFYYPTMIIDAVLKNEFVVNVNY